MGKSINLSLLLLVLIFSACTKGNVSSAKIDSSLDYSKYEVLGEFNLVEIDTAYIENLTTRYERLLRNIPFKAKQTDIPSGYKDSISPIFVDTSFNINVFKNKRDYEVMLSAIYKKYFLKGAPIPISGRWLFFKS